MPAFKDAWTPFAEISTSLYPYLEQFHHHNPTQPHPPHFQLTNIPSRPISLPNISPANNDNIAQTQTPSPKPWIREYYEPPSVTITRIGQHVDEVAQPLYPEIPFVFISNSWIALQNAYYEGPSTPQHTTIQYGTVRHVAVWCSAVQRVTAFKSFFNICSKNSHYKHWATVSQQFNVCSQHKDLLTLTINTPPHYLNR